MNQSFYTAALGAGSQQEKLNVIANNLANVNTYAFKPKSMVFSTLVSYDLNRGAAAGKSLKTDAGMRVQRTDTDYTNEGFIETGAIYDYAIIGDGYFMVQDPQTDEVSYTRNGHFSLINDDDTYYLYTDSGKRVLDREGSPYEVDIKRVTEDEEEEEDEDDEDDDEDDGPKIGVYQFAHPSQLVSAGEGEYKPMEGVTPEVVENNYILLNKHLEMSGTDMPKEISQMIISQRAYSYALKMVTTSDEIENTINTLRA